MATKAKKAPSKAEKEVPAKKKAAAQEALPEGAPVNPEISADEREELEEQAEAAAAGTGAAGGNDAALAAAASQTDTSASFKNFRHHPDMENFYRFIYENDLRHEALAIIDDMMNEKQARRTLRAAKVNAH